MCALLLGLSFVRICVGLLAQRICPTGRLCCGCPLVCAGFASFYAFAWGDVMICLVMLVGAKACPARNGSAPGALQGRLGMNDTWYSRALPWSIFAVVTAIFLDLGLSQWSNSYGRKTWSLSLGPSRIVSISCGVPILI